MNEEADESWLSDKAVNEMSISHRDINMISITSLPFWYVKQSVSLKDLCRDAMHILSTLNQLSTELRRSFNHASFHWIYIFASIFVTFVNI